MKRILELDILRALAIVMIVISHLPPIGMLPISPAVKWWLAVIGVSLFLFISGIVLTPPQDIKKFYKRRALRIYPPYFIIMGVYVLLQYELPDVARTLGIYLSPAELVVNLAGAQAVLNVPSYGVLWFVGIILVYYAIYPLLGSRWVQILTVALATVLAFFALRAIGCVIPQLIYYWPVFIGGVLLRGKIPGRLAMRRELKPILAIAGASYWIYLTHMLVIGFVVLLLSSASVAPLVVPVNNNTTINATTTTAAAVVKQPHYILYYFTMSAPCPAGVQFQKDVTAWARAHPGVEFSVQDADGSLGTKYDTHLSPTTVMLKDGVMVGRWVGIFDIGALDKSIK